MSIVKTPDRTYTLGEKGLPSLGQKVVSWPWGGTPHLTQWSLDALRYPLGTIIMDTIDGHPVIAQIQTHDTYGAHPEWGIKLHKGTSVYVPVTVDGSSGKEIAMRDPPEGWGVSPMGAWREAMRGGRFVDRHEERWGANRGVHRDPYAEAARYFVPINQQQPLPPSPPPTTAIQPSNDTGVDMEPRHWRDHFAKIPKLAVLAGTTIAGLAIVGTPVGAAIGLAIGLVADKEVRGGGWLPSFHGEREEHDRHHRHHRGEEMRRHEEEVRRRAEMNGEGTWKVFRYSPTEGTFHYLAMVNAGSEGSAMDAATRQVFDASAAKPYSLPGFTNVYITSNGDVFRLGMES
jgi:hypothetical protein